MEEVKWRINDSGKRFNFGWVVSTGCSMQMMCYRVVHLKSACFYLPMSHQYIQWISKYETPKRFITPSSCEEEMANKFLWFLCYSSPNGLKQLHGILCIKDSFRFQRKCHLLILVTLPTPPTHPHHSLDYYLVSFTLHSIDTVQMNLDL